MDGLMERFLKNFATKRSPKSVVVYRSNLNIFFVWNLLENSNKPFAEIKKLEMLDFFDYAQFFTSSENNRSNGVRGYFNLFSDRKK